MESIIAKIQKLLALGERGGTEAEAEAAMQKVHELLAKHNLSLDEVKDAVEDEDYVQDFVTATNKQPWQDYIWAAISKLYFCQCYQRKKMSGGKVASVQHMVIGKPTNIAVVKYVASYVVRTGEALAREAAKDRGDSRTFINSFKRGFAARINARVNEEIRKAREGRMTDSATGTALVVAPLYDQAKRDIDSFLCQQGIRPRQGTSRATGIGNSDGYRAGHEAADSVSLRSNGLNQAKTHAIGGGA